MSESDVLKQFYRFNRDVRLNYLKTLASLPPEELMRDRGASYPTLLDIFVHVVGAYNYWFVRRLHVIGDVAAEADIPMEIESLEDATRFEEVIGSSVLTYIDGLTESDLNRTMDVSKGQFMRLGDVCWHLVEEELQHRGEMNALLWQMNIDPPVEGYENWVLAKGSTDAKPAG